MCIRDSLHLLIQTGSRILEDHLPSCLQHFLMFPEFFFVTDIYIFVPDFSLSRLIDIHKAPSHSRLSRTGFSYQTKDLTFINLERDIIHSLYFDLFCQMKLLGQMPDI